MEYLRATNPAQAENGFRHYLHKPEWGVGVDPNVLEMLFWVPIYSDTNRHALGICGVGEVPYEDDAHFVLVRKHGPLLRHEFGDVGGAAIGSMNAIDHLQNGQPYRLPQSVYCGLDGH